MCTVASFCLDHCALFTHMHKAFSRAPTLNAVFHDLLTLRCSMNHVLRNARSNRTIATAIVSMARMS